MKFIVQWDWKKVNLSRKCLLRRKAIVLKHNLFNTILNRISGMTLNICSFSGEGQLSLLFRKAKGSSKKIANILRMIWWFFMRAVSSTKGYFLKIIFSFKFKSFLTSFSRNNSFLLSFALNFEIYVKSFSFL